MDQGTIRPRIDDVAREAGLSKAAVSLAVDGRDRLGPETARRSTGPVPVTATTGGVGAR